MNDAPAGAGHAAAGATERATTRDWIGLAVIALPCLLYSMDLTVLYLAVPQITRALEPSAAELLWIVDIYGFMVAGWLAVMGTLGDRIGRRRLLLIGASAFGVASVLVAFAPSAKLLIAARALQGIAGATLAPSTLSLIRSMFLSDRQRALAIGLWVASFSAGAVLGPVIGGAILAHFWWGAVFLINVPMMALILIAGPVLLPEHRDPEARSIDLASALMSLCAVLLVMFGIKRLAESGASPIYFAYIGAGALIGAAFVRRQRRLADPMIDVSLFASPTFCAALGVNALGLFTVLGTFLMIAQYLQLVVGMGPLEAGLWTAPSGVAFSLGSMLAPFLVHRFAAGRVIATGFLLAALGFAMFWGLSESHGVWLLFAGMMTFCLGLSPVGATTTDIVMAQAPPERAGAASAISEASFELGGAVGIAVLGSLAAAIYRSHVLSMQLDDVPLATLNAARMTLGGAIDASRSLPTELAAYLVTGARGAFVDAMQVCAAASSVSCIAAAVIALIYLPTSDPRLRGRT